MQSKYDRYTIEELKKMQVVFEKEGNKLAARRQRLWDQEITTHEEGTHLTRRIVGAYRKSFNIKVILGVRNAKNCPSFKTNSNNIPPKITPYYQPDNPFTCILERRRIWGPDFFKHCSDCIRKKDKNMEVEVLVTELKDSQSTP